MVTHSGSCHCGRVTFEVDAPDVLELDRCNCSICVKSGYLHHVVDRDKFRITGGEEHLTRYKFGTGIAEHPFCSHCGIKAFYYPRAYPQGVSVNANCLDEAKITSMSVTRHFDAKNWEAALDTFRTPAQVREKSQK